MKEKELETGKPEKQEDIFGDRPGKGEFLIVGIGASAGGIQALKKFFEQVKADSDMAYVVILHLSPSHDSILAQILQTVASIPVTQVTEKVHVEKNHVYVVPPNHHLEMLDGSIIVTQNTLIEDRRAPVDIFFRTLAESHDSKAVAVILSGTGANGSMGIKRIKEKGGVCFVQYPGEAEFNEMPRNSIATGLVDDVLPVAKIPAKIIDYKNNLGKIKIPEEPVERPEEQQQALREIFTQLRIRTGHDFSNYKRPTLLRRIERRVNVRNLGTLAEYAHFLHQHPEETQALLKDLLISVTNFFRDAKTFQYLEQEVVPQILDSKKADGQVRIWVAGCATGEEAYSLAMLFAEQVPGFDAPNIQIFATDIDEDAIAAARNGCYTINDAADVSPERLHRFFVKEGDEYRIRREIREMVLFARHNAIKDPPFSHLDMISCRNLLIYLNQVGQERLMETFHFALDSGSFLMLGMSETVDGSADLYTAISRENHIYKSRQTPVRMYPVPESVPQFNFEKIQVNDTLQNKESRRQERVSYGQLHGRLLEQYAPPSVIINEEYDIVHVSENAGRFLQITGGEPTQNLLKLVKPELHFELMSALFQAAQRRINVEIKNLKVNNDNDAEIINIYVRPVLKEGDDTSGFILVLFEPVKDGKEESVVLARNEPVAKQLEAELTRIKVQLRTSVEQHEFQAEELKASNEELQAMNEELRSATEELETSKEELQSINEELITVNQELKIKVEEVLLSGNNLQNLINSTDIGTVFLDRSFRINMFTPSAKNIFNLIPNDYGRLLSDITHKLKNVDLQADAETVINRLTALEREVETSEGKSYLMHVLPYRTAEDHINGVVITFVDITSRKRAEEESAKQSNLLALAMQTANTAWGSWDWETGRSEWSENAKRIMGFETEKESQTAEGWLKRVHPEDVQEVQAHIAAAAAEHKDFDMEYRVVHADGEMHYIHNTGKILYNKAGKPVQSTGFVIDVTEKMKTAEALRESEARLHVTMESATDYAIVTTDTEGKIELWNSGAEGAFGYTANEIIGKPAYLIFTDEDQAAGVPAKEMEMARKEGRAPDERWHKRKDGTTFFMSGVMRPIYNPELTGYVKVARDMTEQRKAAENLRIWEERYRIALQSAEMAAWDWNVVADKVTWNEQHHLLLGLTPDNKDMSSSYFLQYIFEDDVEKVTEALRTAVEKTGIYQAEFRIKRADNGEVRWMNGFGRTVAAENGRATRMVGVMFEITGRKHLEQQKEDFISIASHELKSPVTSIKAYAEVLLDIFTHDENHESAALMQKLDAQVDRLIDLIRALLDTSKIVEGELVLKMERFDLCNLIEERMQDLQRLTTIHRLITQKPKETFVTADREKIGQVFTNFISNAIKYSPKGGDITVEWKRIDNEIQVRVKDEGIGISEEAKQKVFERFFRVKNAQMNSFSGMGLGLFITVKIIQKHGGRTWVESIPGDGATFYFTLPA